MKSFEVIVNAERFVLKPSDTEQFTYSLFNHATCHIIKKNSFGIWQSIEHRFGTDKIPLEEIGIAIDKFYSQVKQETAILHS